MWILGCRTKSRKKRPKFAAVDLFPRAWIWEKCDFWVVARKAEKRGPNSPPLIYFHAHVYGKNVTFELLHEKQKKEAQICRRWFISKHMYIGKCCFWVVARKSERRKPNSLPLIYFHAHVCWKMWLLNCHTKIRKKRPKFAAADLFPHACILENLNFELSHEN